MRYVRSRAPRRPSPSGDPDSRIVAGTTRDSRHAGLSHSHELPV
ncbi:hypothetical protein BURMUCF2_3426 [Burkholderia multivorans CF2]|nr:hypothetical protein BURMUCF2_3426 [Burkholderia multivorans CF2]